MRVVKFILSLVLLFQIGGYSQQNQNQNQFLTSGIFLGKIEEGARIFTPTRLLPFDHPEALEHEFPTALKLHKSEFETIVYLGKQVGIYLTATLNRYPVQPVEKWWYSDFEELPVDEIKSAEIIKLSNNKIPLPGLKVVAVKNHFPLAFIVDTRNLTLQERGMERTTAMGLDLTREEFLNAINKINKYIPSNKSFIVIFK